MFVFALKVQSLHHQPHWHIPNLPHHPAIKTISEQLSRAVAVNFQVLVKRCWATHYIC